MRLLIARHGETDWLVQYRYQGRSDVALNEKGREQTQKMVRALSAYKPAHVYSSHLMRTREAAELLSKNLNIPHTVDERIAERSFGVWEGLAWNEIKARYPEQIKPYKQGLPDFAPDGGESLIDVLARWKPFLADVIGRHPEEDIAMVSHGGFIRVGIMDIVKSSLDAFHHIRLDPATLSIIRGNQKHLQLILLNSHAHLIENGAH